MRFKWTRGRSSFAHEGHSDRLQSDIWTETSLPLNEPYLFRDKFFFLLFFLFIDEIIITNARTHARTQESKRRPASAGSRN